MSLSRRQKIALVVLTAGLALVAYAVVAGPYHWLAHIDKNP